MFIYHCWSKSRFDKWDEWTYLADLQCVIGYLENTRKIMEASKRIEKG